MSEGPIDLSLVLDAGPYIAGAREAAEVTDQLTHSVTQLEQHQSRVGRGFQIMTPTRAALAGMAGITAAAAAQEQRLSQLAAAQAVTGQSAGRLTRSMNDLARSFPVGQRGAEAIVQSITSAGLTAAGSERRVAQLSKTVTQLGGATGENAALIGRSMVQVNRAFGDTKLDPARMNRMADSLTTLSKTSGASASGILDFSKAIAPFARQAGIGQTSVMGISAAFSKLGEDGYGAMTAVNKILSDLNRSARDGGAEMNTYAAIVGKTRQEFEAMYKADPTEVLTKVTEALGRPGGQAQRDLERLGLEGVRTQRALTAVSQGGELRSMIAQATAGYGSGSTAEASKQAYKGLNDSFTTLRTTSEQLATALGGPFLGSVTRVVDVMGAATGALAKGAEGLAGNRVVQGLGSAVTYGGMALLAGRALAGPVTALGIGRLARSAGIVQAFRGGSAVARYGGNVDAALGTRGGQAGRYMIDAAQSGALYEDDSFRGRAYQRAYSMGQGFGQERMLNQAYAQNRMVDAYARAGLPAAMALQHGAGGWRGKLGRGIFGAGTAAYQAYQQEFSEASLLRDSTEPNALARGRRPRANAEAWRGLWQGARGAAGNRDMDQLRVAVRMFNRELNGTHPALAGFRRAVSASTTVARAQFGAGASMAGAGLMRGGRALMGFMGGPIGIALAAGTAGAAMWQNGRGDARERTEHLRGMSISGQIDAYRESIGLAVENTRTMADVFGQASKDLSRATQTISQARQVTAEDLELARRTRDRRIQDYRGMSNTAISARIGLLGDLSPQELQAIKIDVGRSVGGDRLPAIMGQTGPAPGTPEHAAALFGGLGARYTNRGWGNLGAGNSATGGGRVAQDIIEKGLSLLGKDTLSKTDKESMDAAAQWIARQFEEDTAYGGLEYAQQQRRINVSTYHDKIQQTGGRKATEYFNEATDYKTAMKVGNELWDKRGPIDPTKERGPMARLAFQADQGIVGSFYDNTITSGANRAVEASRQAPDDAAKFAFAVESMADAATASGQSMLGTANSALRLANALDQTSTAYAQQRALRQEMELRISGQGISQSSGQNLAAQMELAGQRARLDPNNPEMAGERQQGRAQMVELTRSYSDMLKQRLMAQFQFQVQSNRAASDFNLQRTRAEEDYRLSVRRGEEDFQRSMQRGEADFRRGRLRQQRDYNIQLRRMAEDGAKSLYDPYKRIATQGTWDAQNLMVNLRNQQAAIEGQIKNLSRARQAGLSPVVIRMLGLDDPNNAQQLARLIGDMASDPRLVAQLNAQGAAREKASGQLLTDPSNTNFVRTAEDFARAQADAAQDFKISITRSTDDFRLQLNRGSYDFAKSLERSTADFRKSMARMREDLKNSQMELVGNLEDLEKAVSDAAAGRAVNWGNLLVDTVNDTMKRVGAVLNSPENQAQAFVLGLRSTPPAPKSTNSAPSSVAAGRGGTPTGTAGPNAAGPATSGNATSVGADKAIGYNAMADIIKAAMPGARITSGYREKSRGFHGVGRAIDIGAGMEGPEWGKAVFSWIRKNYPNTAELFFSPAGFFKNGTAFKPSAELKADHYDHVHWAMARGGVATRPTRAIIAEAGSNEAVIPLDTRGVRVIAAAIEQFISRDQARTLTTAASRTHIEYHEVTYDHSNQFSGPVHVTAQDPNEMARKLEAKARQGNLVGAPQRKR